MIVISISVILKWKMKFKKILFDFKMLTYCENQNKRKRKRQKWMNKKNITYESHFIKLRWLIKSCFDDVNDISWFWTKFTAFKIFNFSDGKFYWFSKFKRYFFSSVFHCKISFQSYDRFYFFWCSRITRKPILMILRIFKNFKNDFESQWNKY